MAMDGLNFEWDSRKDAANRKKHGVSFDEARTAFFDKNARFIADPDHSDEEDRFVLLGSEFSVTYWLSVIATERNRKPFV